MGQLSSTGPLSDLRYMFRQTKEWRQAAEPAYQWSHNVWVVACAGARIYRTGTKYMRIIYP